jgi:hypothetical protein
MPKKENGAIRLMRSFFRHFYLIRSSDRESGEVMRRKEYVSCRMSEQEIKAVNLLARSYDVSRSELIRTLITREIVDQAHLIEFMSKKSSSNAVGDAVNIFRVKLEGAYEREG